MITEKELSVLTAHMKNRIWVFNEQKMYYSDNSGLGMGANGTWWQFADQGYYLNNKDESPDFMLMPFIGFQVQGRSDKVDMYVGDIVDHGYQSDNRIFTYRSVIIPSPNEACYYFGMLDAPQINKGRLTRKKLYGRNQICHVIGNVFENYESLGVRHE